MTNNPTLSNIQTAQQFAMYRQEIDVLKREQEELLARVRVELEEKRQQDLLAKINKD